MGYYNGQGPGGLKNINNKTFNFFIALEESFRRRVGMGTEYMINMSEWLCGDDAVQNKWQMNGKKRQRFY